MGVGTRVHGCLLVALLFGLSAGFPACGGKGSKGKKPARAKKTEKRAEEPAADPKPREGPHPARVALEAMEGIKNDAPADKKMGTLSLAYREYLTGKVLETRAELVRMEGLDMPEALRRLKEMLEKQGRKIDIDGNFIKKFSKENEGKAEALFGSGCKELKAMDDEEMLEKWLARNWESKVRPDLEGMFPAGECDRIERVYLSYRKGRGKKLEIAMIMEEGAFKYGGTRKERGEYLRGPERAALFEQLPESGKREEAENSLQELVSALLDFRKHMERYPNGIEGLEALFTKPGGPESQKWLGPYARNIHDPWGNRFRLKVPGIHNTDFYDMWSPGPDGTDGTKDDITNW